MYFTKLPLAHENLHCATNLSSFRGTETCDEVCQAICCGMQPTTPCQCSLSRRKWWVGWGEEVRNDFLVAMPMML